MLQPYFETGLLDSAARSALNRDLLAYGMKATRSVVEMIAQYVHEQGLTSRRVAVDELFAPSTLDV